MPNNIKKELHNYIDSIESSEQLNILQEAAAEYLAISSEDLTDEQLAGIQLAKQQIANGDFFTANEVAQKVKEWLATNTK